MLEAYQAYTDYQGIMDLTQELITQAAKDVTGGTKTKWGEQEIDWANWQRLTMREAIIKLLAGGGRCEAWDERLRFSRWSEEAGRALQSGARAHGLRSEGTFGQDDCEPV